MELLIQLQREADLAAKDPARAGSTIGFEEIRRVTELGREFAYRDYLAKLEAVVQSDAASHLEQRAPGQDESSLSDEDRAQTARVIAEVAAKRDSLYAEFKAAHATYESAAAAVGAVERAHAACLGATTEMLGNNPQQARVLARGSSVLMDEASGHLARVGKQISESTAFTSVLAAVRRVNAVFHEGFTKLESKMIEMKAEHPENWQREAVGAGFRAASRVASDLGARVAAMPQRALDRMKATGESITSATMTFAAGLLSKTFKVGQTTRSRVTQVAVDAVGEIKDMHDTALHRVAQLHDVAHETVSGHYESIVGKIRQRMAAAGSAMLDKVGAVVSKAADSINRLDAAVGTAGVKLAQTAATPAPTVLDLKNQMQAAALIRLAKDVSGGPADPLLDAPENDGLDHLSRFERNHLRFASPHNFAVQALVVKHIAGEHPELKDSIEASLGWAIVQDAAVGPASRTYRETWANSTRTRDPLDVDGLGTLGAYDKSLLRTVGTDPEWQAALVEQIMEARPDLRQAIEASPGWNVVREQQLERDREAVAFAAAYGISLKEPNADAIKPDVPVPAPVFSALERNLLQSPSADHPELHAHLVSQITAAKPEAVAEFQAAQHLPGTEPSLVPSLVKQGAPLDLDIGVAESLVALQKRGELLAEAERLTAIEGPGLDDADATDSQRARERMTG